MAEDAWLTSHAFLRFESEGDAAAALAAVPRNAPWAAAGGRKLVANYADLRRDKVRQLPVRHLYDMPPLAAGAGSMSRWAGAEAPSLTMLILSVRIGLLACTVLRMTVPLLKLQDIQAVCPCPMSRRGRCPGRWPPAAMSWGSLGLRWCTSS